jgi:hypothetical protein
MSCQTEERSDESSIQAFRDSGHLSMPDPRAPDLSSNQPRLECTRTFERGGVSVARAGRPRAAESHRPITQGGGPAQRRQALGWPSGIARAGMIERKWRTSRWLRAPKLLSTRAEHSAN